MPPLWYIGFCDISPAERQLPHFRNRVLIALLSCLSPGFRHCLAYRPLGDEKAGLWLVVNPSGTALDVLVMDLYPPVYFHMTAVLTAQPDHTPLWHPRGLLTCVTAIKHLLGIAAPWILTPWALYWYLSNQKVAMQ